MRQICRAVMLMLLVVSCESTTVVFSRGWILSLSDRVYAIDFRHPPTRGRLRDEGSEAFGTSRLDPNERQ